MTESTVHPPGSTCGRCGARGTSVRGKKARDGRGGRDRQVRVCVPCGRAQGIVWTEYTTSRGDGPSVTVNWRAE